VQFEQAEQADVPFRLKVLVGQPSQEAFTT